MYTMTTDGDIPIPEYIVFHEREDGSLIVIWDTNAPIWSLIRHLETIGPLHHVETQINFVPCDKTEIRIKFVDLRNNQKLFEQNQNHEIEPDKQDFTRLFTIIPRRSTLDDFFAEFEKFGLLDYLYTTSNQKGKGLFGYVRYFSAEDANNALLHANPKYACRLADPQKASKEREDYQPEKVRHKECQRMVTRRQYLHHVTVCKKQRALHEESNSKPITTVSRTEVHQLCGERVAEEDLQHHINQCKLRPVSYPRAKISEAITPEPTPPIKRLKRVYTEDFVEYHPPPIRKTTGWDSVVSEEESWEDSALNDIDDRSPHPLQKRKPYAGQPPHHFTSAPVSKLRYK